MGKYFDLTTAKRYFHFVTFKIAAKNAIFNFWNECGVVVKNESGLQWENSDFKIEQQSLLSSTRFYTGGKDYSVNGDGNAPYSYDLVAIQIKDLDLLIVGFPFKFLMWEIVSKLNNKKTYKTFVKPNLNSLLDASTVSKFSDEDFKCHFSSLGLMLTADKNLTSIEFGGDQPLESPIYKTLFKKVIEKKQANLESCSLKIELESNQNNYVPKTRGNIHIDQFGNLKIYIHGSGKNIFTIPFVFTLLDRFDCIENTFINPLEHLRSE